MLLDYLRYVAFQGRLQAFFEDAVFNYADRADTTGHHLRFDPDYLDETVGLRGQRIVRELYWDAYKRGILLEELKDRLGLAGGPDGLSAPRIDINGPTKTFSYTERIRPRLQIIVDIAPERWSPRYSERREYEDIPVVYRRASPARADFASGDKIFDKKAGPARHGTLCGFFQSDKAHVFALTCGHIAPSGAQMLIEQRRRIWKLPLWSTATTLGETRHIATCAPAKSPAVQFKSLDASLIEVSRKAVSTTPNVMRVATIKPISSMLQEEPVRFRGSGRSLDTLARISAVTVRNS
jgi:hypothetical protein